MAGGEFRFGTDSIYMARHQHRPPDSTSAKIWITWLHYGCVSGAIASLFNTIAVFRRGKLGLIVTRIAGPIAAAGTVRRRKSGTAPESTVVIAGDAEKMRVSLTLLPPGRRQRAQREQTMIPDHSVSRRTRFS